MVDFSSLISLRRSYVGSPRRNTSRLRFFPGWSNRLSSKAAASKGPRHTPCGMSRVRAMRERRWRPVSPSCWRTYQTNGTSTGPFGRGTTHATQIVMLVDGNQRVIRMGDGRRFTLTLQPDGAYRNLTDAALQGTVLTSPSGVPTLQKNRGSEE